MNLPLVNRYYWTIGRGSDSNLVIHDRWISRNHAMLQSTENGQFYLIDLGSRNGTFLNGRRVSIPVILKDRDLITIGNTELEFHLPDHQTRQVFNSIDVDTLTSVLHIRRLMSVMVIDIRDYTVLARQVEENVLSSLVGSWFREAGKIIRNHGSWVDKYIGDALMAIWFHGAEEVKEEEVTQIFRATIGLDKMTRELSQKYPLPLELKIGAGVNTGYAMIGNTGSGDRPDYTAIGDTVNAAFRLESVTKEIGCDLVLGEKTYDYLSKLETLSAQFQKHTVTLKGYEQPKIVYATNFDDLDSHLELSAEFDTAAELTNITDAQKLDNMSRAPRIE